LHLGRTPEHFCPLQLSLDTVQSWHAAPLRPQKLSRLPGRQLPPSQQPDGHVDGLQTGGGCVQRPPPQVPPVAEQSVQNAPSMPQLKSVSPAWQVPAESQHPLHVPGWHPVLNWQKPPDPGPWGTHCPPWAEQSVHACPPIPHSVGRFPVTQRLPSQHPAQFCGPQLTCPPQMPPPAPVEKQVPPCAWQFWQA